MKWPALLYFFFLTLPAFAQEALTYPELLNMTREIQVTDSLLIDAETVPNNSLDTMTVKKWFANLLPVTPNNRLKNRYYYLAGKMTGNNNFDLLMVMEEKKKKDSAGSRDVYLVTCKKDGTFIAVLEVALEGTKKNASYQTSSWLYRDNKIVLSSKMTINEKKYDDLLTYRINKGGRFILAPKY